MARFGADRILRGKTGTLGNVAVSSNVIEKDLGWKRIVQGTRSLSGDTVVAGHMGDTYLGKKNPPDLPVAKVAFWQEFGTWQIGASHFYRSAFDKNLGSYEQTGAAFYRAWVSGMGNLHDGLVALGMMMQDDIEDEIVDRDLIDTGRMRETVKFHVATSDVSRFRRTAMGGAATGALSGRSGNQALGLTFSITTGAILT